MTLSWGPLFALLVGVVAGMIIGILPGLGSSMGVALLIPVTFGMSPSAGLIMLTAVYTSAIYGGSFTSILTHTPGTSSSAATAIDGFELTKKGRGLEAIGVSTIGSVFGGVAGAIALLIIAPPLGRFSLQFSVMEYFLLSVFGIVVIGTMAGDSLAKGLVAGLLGLFIGTIGLDAIDGIRRYTFGILYLEDGIYFVAALIGLFSVSQAMIMAADIKMGINKLVQSPDIELSGRRFPPLKELKTLFPTMIRSAIVGIIIGIIPAAGASISSWVNLSLAKRFSKHPEKIGKGSIEGVMASEVGNNAACGGALIPMITLGIPGSGVTAILLGGLMIHGLIPGIDMFTKHAHITYSVCIGFLLSNIVMGVIGTLIAPKVTAITRISTSILCPLIIALSMVGVYAIRNSIFDVFITVIFGGLGYIMRTNGIPVAPMTLGIVLSNIVENNWRRTLIISRGNVIGYFLARPISIVLVVLLIASVFLPIFMNSIKKKPKAGNETVSSSEK